VNFKLQTLQQLGPHLRVLRRRQGMSQAELGQRIGVSQSRLARIEGDPSSVSFDQLLDLLHALGTQLVLETDDRRLGSTPPPSETGDQSPGASSALDQPW
jgi:HTH-type transcriptional regulator / antitoxin HipB